MSSAVVRQRCSSSERRRQFVAAWRRSGLSQSELARRAGIAQAYVSRWSREQQVTTEPCASASVPVSVVDDAPDRPASATEIRIRVAGAEITLASGFDRKALVDIPAARRY